MQLLIPYFYKGVIYQIINIQNRKSYIGKTSRKKYMKYIKKHFENAYKKEIDEETGEEKYNNKLFYKAIRKYGKQNFKIIILGEIYSDNLDDFNKQLNEAEIDCIYHFRTFGSDGENFDKIYGYNLTKGGEGTAGLIAWNKGLAAWNKGLTKEVDERVKKYGESQQNKIISEKTREKQSIAQNRRYLEGGKNPMQNKKHKESSKIKIGEKSKNRIPSIETRLKMGKARTGDKNGNYRGDIVEKIHIIIELKNKGISTKNLAKLFNCSTSTINRRMRIEYEKELSNM